MRGTIVIQPSRGKTFGPLERRGRQSTKACRDVSAVCVPL